MEKKRLTQRIAMLAATVGSMVLVISLVASRAPAGSPNHQYCYPLPNSHCPSCEDSKDEDVPWQCVPGAPNGYKTGFCTGGNLGDNCVGFLISCNLLKYDCDEPPHSIGYSEYCTDSYPYCDDRKP